jgi:hypothetical protein
MHSRRKCLAAALVLACAANLSLGDVAAGLLGHWALDGDAVDLSGNGHDGTLIGGARFDPDGASGACIELNGTDAYVEMTGYKGPLQSPWTIACWVKTTGTGDMDIVSWGTEGGGLKVEFRFNAGLLRIEHGNGNIRGDVAANDGEWHHAVAQLPQGGLMQDVLFYLDGQPLGIFAVGNGTNPFLTTEGIDFNIGRSGPRGDRYYTGTIDDVRLYDRVLSADEIRQSSRRPQAHNPDPANGAVGVDLPLFQWTPGDGALLHAVYLGTSPDLTQADRVLAPQPAAFYYHMPGLQPGTTYYWRVDETETDMVTVHTGNVWSFVTQDLLAYGPSPADGDYRVTLAPTLTWLPGKLAVRHHLYFSDDLQAVQQGTGGADQDLSLETTFSPGDLQTATTYYWRVDEVLLDGTVRAGNVWSFSTILPIEDFESYTDQPGEEIFTAWIDGFTDGLSGSIVGYLDALNGTFGETAIVHGGKQSMPFEYNNVKTPYYSETQRTFAPTQDWAINGVDTLVLYVRGRSTNGAAPIYVILKDAANRTATVSHPDPAVVTLGKWTEWKIPLSDFAGVNAAGIKTIVIGVGDKSASAPGAAGVIFVDDLYVCKAGPAQN